MSQALSIIIVDDMQFSRAVMRSGLLKLGYEDIRLAASGEEVLRMTAERYADVIIADWVMPSMNGLELLETIRREDQKRDWYTAFILFTAKDEQHAMLEAFRRGVDDYLIKPADPDELAARVYGAGRVAALNNGLLQTSNALRAANRELLESNLIDNLTGLGNRRYLEQRLQSMLRHAHEREGAVCTVLLAIDHFRQINDEYGRDCGDEVLASVALRLRNSVRPTDVVARYGGDTFAVAALHADPSHISNQQVERLVQTVSASAYHTDNGDVSLSASLGANIYRHSAICTPLSNILHNAEQNLTAARQTGRSRAVSS
jgi:two-component system, cell cycle response regulator